MKSYLIGRGRKDGQRPDILIPDADESVGRLHARLIDRGNGCYQLEDMSRNGTYLYHAGGNRVRLKQLTDIQASDTIALGNYKITVRQLLSLLPTDNEGRSVVIERDPETGKFIYK